LTISVTLHIHAYIQISVFVVRIIYFIGCGSTQEVVRNAENCVLGRHILLKEHTDAGFENIFFS